MSARLTVEDVDALDKIAFVTRARPEVRHRLIRLIEWAREADRALAEIEEHGAEGEACPVCEVNADTARAARLAKE